MMPLLLHWFASAFVCCYMQLFASACICLLLHGNACFFSFAAACNYLLLHATMCCGMNLFASACIYLLLHANSFQLVIAGNHDVGHQPTSAAIEDYEKIWGASSGTIININKNKR